MWSHQVREISIPAATRTECLGVPLIFTCRKQPAASQPEPGLVEEMALFSSPTEQPSEIVHAGFVVRFSLDTEGWVKIKTETNAEGVGTGFYPNVSVLRFSQQVGIASDRLQNHLVVKEHRHQ